MVVIVVIMVAIVIAIAVLVGGIIVVDTSGCDG
jgi:hypothetical protein